MIEGIELLAIPLGAILTMFGGLFAIVLWKNRGSLLRAYSEADVDE